MLQTSHRSSGYCLLGWLMFGSVYGIDKGRNVSGRAHRGAGAIATAAPAACNETATGTLAESPGQNQGLVNVAWPAEGIAVGGDVPIVLCSVNVEANDY